ncbi:hypothetical protein AAT19DRAFT_14595 [Rhodotorula toruloides]|uniref:Uncharacterized protein n=1 Tax=Rhodotorula toruloides TaxID=5286 RepID=A0A2T0A891_RHOTO|nr:hypothetical protein AAT19DRAFT_14595 [Rhodotorula toruloides]
MLDHLQLSPDARLLASCAPAISSRLVPYLAATRSFDNRRQQSRAFGGLWRSAGSRQSTGEHGGQRLRFPTVQEKEEA